MTEKEYNEQCVALFATIETMLDEGGVDFDNNGNVIEIFTDDDETIVINKQAPMQEVWLASKSGGRHFRYTDGEWCDTRDATSFLMQLRALLSA